MEYNVVGAMAGSSMDGLDLVLVSFEEKEKSWDYSIVASHTYSYEEDVYQRLKKSSELEKDEKKLLDFDFGSWIAKRISHFLDGHTKSIDLLAVHGHTVMHIPAEGISWQLGNGHAIARRTGITTITDFRTQDIKEGGQGAPLVPFGDFELFGEYDACLNLGGIANVSLRDSKLAWDICPCNQVLNHYASQLGRLYDSSGDMARQGDLDEQFISSISCIDYFDKLPPKSLPNSFIPTSILDRIEPYQGLASYTEFIVNQIASDILSHQNTGKLLVTGGGAFNSFLIERLSKKLKDWEVVIPDAALISFKEALIFAFLGLKRLRNEINVLSSVTGASKDTSSGVIHFPK